MHYFYDSEKDILLNIKQGSKRLAKLLCIIFLYPLYVFGFWTNHNLSWYFNRNTKELIEYIGLHLLGLIIYSLSVLLLCKTL